MIKTATFSDCRKYRYTLERIWDESKSPVMFIGLNPSTADETNNDSTIRRCINYARSWGYGGLIMTNMFAYRTRYPYEMMAAADPVGPENDCYLEATAKCAGIVIAAWGNDGQHFHRYKKVQKIVGDRMACLKLTGSKQPAHPLYLKKDLKPIYFITGKPVDIPGIEDKQMELFNTNHDQLY